jgi:signal peptide peptidase SppA
LKPHAGPIFMHPFPHLAARLLGVPLAVTRAHLDAMLAVLHARIDLGRLPDAAGRIAPKPRATAPPHIAVLPVHGTLAKRSAGLDPACGLTSYESLSQHLSEAVASPEVEAILLDIDSPGGEASGLFDFADRVRAAAATKPLWAVANDQALSAAYAIASGAQRLYVTRTSGVGSIGVIAMHVDQSGHDAQQGLRYTPVYAGDRKADLNPHAPLTGEAHAALQAEVNRLYELFVQTVAQHRGLDPDAVRGTQAGVFHGSDALAAGLADALGTLDDALAELSASLRRPMPVRPDVAHAIEPPSSPSMQTTPTTPVVEPGASAPAPAPAVAAAPVPAPAHFHAVEIAQACQLAGRPDLTLGFLASGATLDEVRSHLLASRAQASPAITTRIAPEAAASAPAPQGPNPVVEAARALAARAAARHAAMKGAFA